MPSAQYAVAEELNPAVVQSEMKKLKTDRSEITTRDVLAKKAIQSPEIIEDLDGPPARSVRIDLKKVEEAAFYEVAVVPAKKIWAEPLRFKTKGDEPNVRLRLSPGQYSVQTRSLDDKKVPGRWSPLSKFWIQFRPIPHAFPSPNQRIEPKSSTVESIIFEWSSVESARYYFFRLKDETGQIIRMAITDKNYLKSEVKVNSKYTWSVLPMISKDQYKTLYAQDSNTVYSPFSVLLPDESTRGTLVQIKTQPKAIKYQFEVVTVDAMNTASPPSVFESYDGRMRFRLPPGEYELRVRSVFENKKVTAWSPPRQLFIKRFVPTLISPIDGETLESSNDGLNSVALKWKKDPTAQSFQVYVFNDKKELVRQEAVKTNEAMVELPDDQAYHWTVRAYSAREIASESVKPEDATGRFQINRYIPLNLGSTEEPSQYYGWLRQITSMESYYGESFENNSIVTQKFFGGETEGAIGYWQRKTRFGILAHGGLAGFLFRNKNYLYSDGGMHVGYRHFLRNGDRMRFWAGVAYREMPEVLTHPYTQNVDFNKIKSLGPQVQAVYHHSLTEKLGLQAGASIFQSYMNMGTPNGEDQKAKLSYRGNLMGSYVWSPTTRLLGGYTYRLDQAEYNSKDTPGQMNLAQISGHYLSLSLEFALEESMK